MGWQKTLPAIRAVWLLFAAQAIVAAVATDVGRTNEGLSVSDKAWNSIPGSARTLQQVQVVNPAGAVLPTQTPDPRLPVAGNSQFVGSAETAISEDPVDIRIRNAFAPILDPIVDALYRRPASADPTAAAFGTGSPLRAFGDLVGSRIIRAVSATLLGLPRNRLVIDAINANSLWNPVLATVSAVGNVVGPIESAALRLGTFVRTFLTGGSVPDAVARAGEAGTNQQGLDNGAQPSTPLDRLPATALRNAVLPTPNGRKLQDLSSFLPSATPLPELKAIPTSSFAVALDSLIADVPVDANLEKALSPVVDPIVQYIVSTPALATPLARLLGVNSQLESVLDNIGTPVLSLVTGFLKTNPVAAQAAQTFAASPATQAFIRTLSGIAVGIGPAEKAALAGATAVGNVAHGAQAAGATVEKAAQTVAGRRHLLDSPAVDAATATAAVAASASSLPLLPGLLPSNALTDALDYLHAHPQLRSALITFLEADSTKEFLATVTQLAIKINPKQFAALAGAVLIGEGAISAVVVHTVVDRIRALLAPSPPPVPQQPVPAVPVVPTALATPVAPPATPVTPPITAAPAFSSPPPAATVAPPPPVPTVPASPAVPAATPSPALASPVSTPAAATPTPTTSAIPVATPVSTPAPTTPMPTPSPTPTATPASTPAVATPTPTPSPTPTPPATSSPVQAAPAATFIPDLSLVSPAMPISTALPLIPSTPTVATPSPTPAATPPATPVPTLAPTSPGAPASPVAPFVAFGGKRHLLQGNVLTALFPSQTPNPRLPDPSNNPALAEYSILTSEDPFDQELTQALGPLLEPVATLLSRTPAISNMLGGPFGVNSTLVERLTDAALPLITGFRSNILQNPVLVEAIDFAAQTPLLQGFFDNVGNFSGDLAPVIRAYTRIGTYLGAVTGGQNASEALNAALGLFPEQAAPDQVVLDQPRPAQAPADSAPPQHSPPAQHSPTPRSPGARREANRSNHSSPAPPHSPAGRHLLQSTAARDQAPLNIVDFLPRQTPNPALHTLLNNPALGAIRQVVADDPFAQRIVTALAPTLAPIVQYAARTPFFSSIITAIASSDDPVVKQITADVTPILNTFSQGILQNPAAASVLNGLTTGPEVSAFVNQVQSLASLLSPNVQSLLNGASFLGNITSILQSQQAEVANLLQGPTPTPTPQPGLPLPNLGRRLQQAQEPQLPPLTQFLPAQTPNPDLPTPANNQALGIPSALKQVVRNDPVNSRLEAVLAPALAPIFAYVARTPAFSNAITAVAGANSTLVQQLTQIATPLLNTFLQGILDNPVARQTLQDLTVTPNLERFIQGLQNLTQITQPPIVSLLNGASFLGNISSILQQQEQAISRALAAPRNGPSRGLLQAGTGDLLAFLGIQDAGQTGQALATPVIAAANVPGQTPLPNVAAILPSQTPNPSLPTSSNNAALAALEGIIANDPFDQQLEAVLSPTLGPLLSAISRTPAISNAIASALGSNNGLVEDITQALTPLFRTFFVGILQNPFAYEALQNFTTSPSTQGLLSGLRNATELGLPALQRVLGTANFLGNISSILQSEINLFSPAQTPSPPPSGVQRDSNGVYDQGVSYGRLGGGRHLLQSPVTAGQFLQQFFNPYYAASPPPAAPSQSRSPGNPLRNALLPPDAASLGQLVQQLVASQAQPPAGEPVPAQPPPGTQSPAPAPTGQPPVLASPSPGAAVSPVTALPPAGPPVADLTATQHPPVAAADGLVTAAGLVIPQIPADPFGMAPAAELLRLPGSRLPEVPGNGLGQGSFLPAGISALATAAVLADQVRPQVNDLAGLLAKEAGTALTDSPVGELLHRSAVSDLLPSLGIATPPPPATLSTLLAGLLPPGSPPAPPPSLLPDLPAALGSAGSLINATVTGLTDNVRLAAQAVGTDPLSLLLDAAQDAPTPAPPLTGISGALSGAGSLVNQTVSGVRQNLQSAAAGLNLTVSQVAGVVGQALGQPAATPQPTPGPPSLSSLLASLGYGAASSGTPASPAGLGSLLEALGGGMPGQTPASSGLGGLLASLDWTRGTLQQGLSGLSNLESLLEPSAQAPGQDVSSSPDQAPVGVPTAQPPSGPPAQLPGPPMPQAPQSSQAPAGSSDPALLDVGSSVNATVAGLVAQINTAVASLNSTTAAAVGSLTAAVQRYNAAAAALEVSGGMTNVTERLMNRLAAETDDALQMIQSMLSSTGDTVADIFQGMTSALQNATASAAPEALAGAQQLESFVRGAVVRAAEALQGLRGAISDGAAAAGNATASAAAAGVADTVSGLQATASNLRNATAGALTGVGGAALDLNSTLMSFAQNLVGLAEQVALPNSVAGLEAPLNRMRQVAALAGDLQAILGTAALGNIPPALQDVFLGMSASPPSSTAAPNLTALDNSLVQLLSEDSAQPSLAPEQAPVHALSMPPPQPSLQEPVPTPAMSSPQPPFQAPLVAPSSPPSRPPVQVPLLAPSMPQSQPPLRAPLVAPSMPPSESPIQAPLVAPSMPPSQPPVQASLSAPVRLLPQLPVQAGVITGSPSAPREAPQLLPGVALGLGAVTDRLQAVSQDAQGLNALLGSGVLGLASPAVAEGALGPGGLNLTLANSQLLQLLSAEGPATAQAPDQDTASVAPDPAAVNLTGADSALLSLLSADGPAPAQAPSTRPGSPVQAPQHSPEALPPAPERAHTPASHTRHFLQVAEPAPGAVPTTAPAPGSPAVALSWRLPALPPLSSPEQSSSSAAQAGLLAGPMFTAEPPQQGLNLALPSLVERGLSGVASTEQALLPKQALGSLQADDTVQDSTSKLPEMALGLPGLTGGGQLDAAQAPAETATAPPPEQAQAPAPDLFSLLPRPEPSFRLPNLTMPELPLLSLPSLQRPSQAEDPGSTPALGAGQTPTPSAQPEADLQVPRFALPDEALPSLPSLPPLGAWDSDPAVRQLTSEAAQGPADDPGPATFQLPEVALPQVDVPLLARPEPLSLPFGQAPAESPLSQAVPAPLQLPTADAESSQPAQANAGAEASAKPASEVPSSIAALSVIEGTFAPAASALQAGADSALSQLKDPVRLPQLGLPLLAWPKLPGPPYGQAPEEGAAPPFVSPTDFAAADLQGHKMMSKQAEATTTGGLSAAFPTLESALAPAMSAQALLASIGRDLPQLESRAWSLPQLRVPLLALPGNQQSASAPAPDLAAAMSPVTVLSSLSSRGPVAPNQASDDSQHYYAGAPSQQSFPLLAPAPAQEGLNLLVDLPRLALPRLPVSSGLAQFPALLHGSQDPVLAHSSPPSLATPSSPPQPGVPRTGPAPNRGNPTLPELLARLDPFGNPSRAAAPDQMPAEATAYPEAPRSSDDAVPPEFLANLDPFGNPSRAAAPDQMPAEAPAYLQAPHSSGNAFLLELLADLDPFGERARAPVPRQVPAQAPVYSPAPASNSGGVFKMPAGASVPAQAPFDAGQPSVPPTQNSNAVLQGLFELLEPSRNVIRAPEPGLAPARAPAPYHARTLGRDDAPAPAHAERAEPSPAQPPRHPQGRPPAHAPSKAHAHAPDAAQQHPSHSPGHAARAPSPHHAEQEHHAPKQAPRSSPDHHSHEHDSAAQAHAAKAPSPHHAEHERHAPRQAPHRSPAGRKEAVRAPPPPAGILGAAGSFLGQAARAPLPGVPNVTTGVFLNSLFREVANVTGLLNATERIAQQAQAAGVPGNLTQPVSAARNVTQLFQGIANAVDTSVSVDFRGTPRPSPIQDFIKAFQGPAASQANKTAENVAGFIDIILTQALSMANSLPDLANPLSVIGQDLGFEVETPLSVFVDKLKNLTVPRTVDEAEQEVKGLFSGFCTPSSFDESDMEPSACVSEQVTLQLVPWSCAVDDSSKPATLTCTPAYLQLSTVPASCNLKYRSAPEWSSTECLLNTTIWGKSSQVTWGAKDDLPGLHRAVSNVAEGLSEIGHNLTSAWPMPPMPSGVTMPPRPGHAMAPMPLRPPGMGMPSALSSSGPNGSMDAAGSQVLGAWDLFSNFGQALANFMSTTFHVNVGT